MATKYYLVIDQYSSNVEICRVVIQRGQRVSSFHYFQGRRYRSGPRTLPNMSYWSTSTPQYKVICFEKLTREKALMLLKAMR